VWLTNARYLRPDGTFGTADIGVDGGVVAELAPAGSRPSDVDCSGYVVLPGLVNGHYHSQATLMRGLEVGIELFDWFGDSPGGRAQARIGEWLDDPAHETEIAAVVRHEYVTLLRQGVTLVADSGCSEVSPAVLAAAGDTVGVRSLPQAYDDWIERLPDPARYTVHIESEEDLTAEVLEKAARYEEAYRPVFALHCLETVRRRELVLERWGRSTVAVLADHGLLTPRTVLFHGCEMDAEDVAAVARAGAAVMHCPVSNLGLHGRIPPAVEWWRAGVPMGLGTDWGDTDMWGTLRAAWLLQQREPDRDRRARPADVLRMATRGGALGYGRDDLGEIAAGRTADLVLLDAARLGPYSPDTLAFAILTDGGTGLVRHVMVGGDWVLRDGAPTRVDAAATAAQYRRIAAALVE
jgi:5-methylthioadenosine/S-adenosylhomocysteine deaminase